MREAGIQGASRRHRKAGLTRRDRKARPAPDLVNRNFAAAGPDQLWVADLTYVRTKAGWLYVAVVLDAWSRLVVGWAMETHLRSELVENALAMAVIRRQPKQVIHHSDQGAQYTSTAFGKRCREAGVRPSMGSVGDAYDNAMCESFFATLECELLDCHQFRNPNQARRAVFDFIEGFYNRRRRNSIRTTRSSIRALAEWSDDLLGSSFLPPMPVLRAGRLRRTDAASRTGSFSRCSTTKPAPSPSHQASRATRLKRAGGRCPIRVKLFGFR